MKVTSDKTAAKFAEIVKKYDGDSWAAYLEVAGHKNELKERLEMTKKSKKEEIITNNLFTVLSDEYSLFVGSLTECAAFIAGYKEVARIVDDNDADLSIDPDLLRIVEIDTIMVTKA